MNTLSLSSKSAAIIAAAILGAITSPVLVAGPGLSRWQPTPAAPTATPVAHAHSMVKSCTDARVATATETKSAWANGRGPSRTIETGKKLICTSCAPSVVTLQPSGHNGRGAMAAVTVAGIHDCTANGCGTTTP